MWKYWYLSVLLIAPAAAVDHPNLSGTWSLDATHSKIHDSKVKTETLQIQQEEDAVQIADQSNVGGKDRKAEYQCLADGSTCKAKDLSVMVYYNGPVLVLMEMRKNNEIVVKKRLTASGDGKTLNMDIIHVAPAGLKDETLTFVKQ
ncbi:MAG TPA: hypothetical protein VKB88_06345 [Bryobacteraceae bacterium]|nr:hypothetical protein [Bryobacteraceae bacterium]